jgi:peptidoglycan/xylan/chitin deacetylase (PgdA/CDA1 family)
MLDGYPWRPVRDELDRWAAAELTARLWLRDDDAQSVTPALEALLGRLEASGAPCMLAVIPMLADAELAKRLAERPDIMVAMHGVRHANHAPEGRKSEETPIERGLDVIEADWRAARARLTGLFGAAAGDWYVPPWNRIAKAAAIVLPTLGFRAVSTFGARRLDAGLAQWNASVDIMDWRNGRIGRAEGEVARDLSAALAAARNQGGRPVGILTHHLVHDPQAWTVLDALLTLANQHPAARWIDPRALIDAGPDAAARYCFAAAGAP